MNRCEGSRGSECDDLGRSTFTEDRMTLSRTFSTSTHSAQTNISMIAKNPNASVG